MHRTVIEVGPSAVRRICCGSTDSGAAGAAALEWIDDPTALLGDEPVPTPELWRRVLDELACPGETLLLIYPSWWPTRRIELICSAAGPPTTTRTRAELLGAEHTTVVEIAPTLVAISAPEATAVPRAGPPDGVADDVAQRVPPGATVLIDAPDGVPGAKGLARLITARLRAAGIRAAPARLHAPPEPAAPTTPPRRRPYRATTAAALLLTAAGVLTTQHPTRNEPATWLVEGRIAVQVPAGWQARRITDGPGSARVEVVAPDDPQLILHLTQALLPDPDPGAVAAALEDAIEQANRPGEIFTDFNPADTRAGRPAISYREHRPGHQIDWTVLIDAGLRIGIGCQHRPGDAAAIEGACTRAVRSARVSHRPGTG